MKKRFQSFLLCVTTLICNPLFSQVIVPVKSWMITDCFQYATEHNIQINTLRLNELNAQQDMYLAKGAKIPSLYGSVGTNFTNGNNDITGNGGFANQLSSTASYSVNSSLVLWNGNYINNNISQTKLLIQSASLSSKQSVNNITLSIAQAYLNILLAKENLKYVADLVNTSDTLVKQGQLLYNAGSVAKINLLQLQAQFASDKYLQIQTENAIRQNILLLKQLLQLSSETPFDIVTPSTIEVVENLPSLEIAQQTASENFPEIKIGKLGLDIASLSIAKAKAGFKPVLSATASIGSGFNNIITNSNYSNSDYFTQNGNNFYQRAGLNLTIPVFSNHINKTNLEKANIGFSQSKLNLQNYQLVLSQAVEQAYLNASNTIQAYKASKEQLTAATESFRIINEQFKLGGTNAFAVLQLRNQYVQAVQAFTQAKYNAILQYKIYEFYLGNPVTL